MHTIKQKNKAQKNYSPPRAQIPKSPKQITIKTIKCKQ
ncbi:hypothetical protein BbuZS7_E17 (plasmid) [Borreliella burgdorferi ZS7]|uniref:Uncharacterized protein n=1 Tax=Borreliella burgdorferi (strain ZS7) TaxID=445985 RepID=A0A0H3C2T9_BORBZ|nr:hypothetical protein BbuZS7_E17 [Borreliella burgdorferi ZS7]